MVLPVPLMLTWMPFVDVLPLPGFCVISNASPVLLFAKVSDVGDAKPDAKVKAIFRPVVVLIVLPLL